MLRGRRRRSIRVIKDVETNVMFVDSIDIIWYLIYSCAHTSPAGDAEESLRPSPG